MRNRAKCKKCECILESFFPDDYVHCKCGEIAIKGSKRMAVNWENFLSIHDDDSEHPVKIVEKDEIKESIDQKPTRDELIQMLDSMEDAMHRLPPEAMTQPITHYDFASLIVLVSSILKLKE